MRGSDIGYLLLLASAGYVAYSVYAGDNDISDAVTDVANTIVSGAWATSGNAPQYIPYINTVEASLGIPQNLLARLAYTESHFRSDIISGATVSSAGAVGMFQLLPQYFPGAGTSWETDAQTAGQYLVQMYNEFGDWQSALAAYNWGPGNYSKWLAAGSNVANMPLETQNYVSGIVADVPITGVLVNV